MRSDDHFRCLRLLLHAFKIRRRRDSQIGFGYFVQGMGVNLEENCASLSSRRSKALDAGKHDSSTVDNHFGLRIRGGFDVIHEDQFLRTRIVLEPASDFERKLPREDRR